MSQFIVVYISFLKNVFVRLNVHKYFQKKHPLKRVYKIVDSINPPFKVLFPKSNS